MWEKADVFWPYGGSRVFEGLKILVRLSGSFNSWCTPLCHFEVMACLFVVPASRCQGRHDAKAHGALPDTGAATVPTQAVRNIHLCVGMHCKDAVNAGPWTTRVASE